MAVHGYNPPMDIYRCMLLIEVRNCQESNSQETMRDKRLSSYVTPRRMPSPHITQTGGLCMENGAKLDKICEKQNDSVKKLSPRHNSFIYKEKRNRLANCCLQGDSRVLCMF